MMAAIEGAIKKLFEEFKSDHSNDSGVLQPFADKIDPLDRYWFEKGLSRNVVFKNPKAVF
jgi:hypothetical protein